MSQHYNVLPSRFIVQELESIIDAIGLELMVGRKWAIRRQELEEYTDREKRLLRELDYRLDRLQATSARLETLSIDIQEAP
jgi:predicted secreted Zn-dependent protease